MSREQRWPREILIVRHGESAGNVARNVAEAAGHDRIAIPERDADVPLSDLGARQARALGRWLGALPPERRPDAVLMSPYVRARQTGNLALESAGLDVSDLICEVDERLREKEFGTLDRLTLSGIRTLYPDQAEFRRHLGKFYHRPPGGESWCDVILRLRSVLDTLTREFCEERVLLVCHQVVVLCFRYLLEHMTEEQLLAVDRETRIANCAVTSYEYDPSLGRHGGMALRRFNFVAPLEEAGAPVTREPDVPLGPK